MAETDEWLTVREVAELTGLTEQAIRGRCYRTWVQAGLAVKVPKQSVEGGVEWLIKPTAVSPAEVQQLRAEPPPPAPPARCRVTRTRDGETIIEGDRATLMPDGRVVIEGN